MDFYDSMGHCLFIYGYSSTVGYESQWPDWGEGKNWTGLTGFARFTGLKTKKSCPNL
jgi:hypothetical protein